MSVPWTDQRFTYGVAPRNVYWETTSACDLACAHCRAEASPERSPDELSTEQARQLIRDIRRMGSMLILTGGDPLKRQDLFELIAYARELGVPVSITPSTTPLLTAKVMKRFRELGVAALGLSLDGPSASVHDAFRRIPGTFERALAALSWAREEQLPVQVNTTVTAQTAVRLPELFRLLSQEHAPPVRRWSLFLVIPVGRGLTLAGLSPKRVDQLLEWVYEVARDAPFHTSLVEAPLYRRYWLERRVAEGASLDELLRHARHMGFGVRDGNGVVFVSQRGEVYPSGFLPLSMGNVLERPLPDIYRGADFERLRDMDRLDGPCGRCEFRWICGGSRARAYAVTGNPLGSDPVCSYEPQALSA
jgi:AdoMet-dependent heme synthase